MIFLLEGKIKDSKKNLYIFGPPIFYLKKEKVLMVYFKNKLFGSTSLVFLEFLTFTLF